MSDIVHIGKVPVGDGYPAVFMAEIGTFFNQERELAADYLRRIAEAGAPVFKTEILHDPDVCLPSTGLVHEYNHARGKSAEDYRALIERKCNPLAVYEGLMAECGRLGIPFVASIYDPTGADCLAANGGAALKIARNNIDNIPLIRHCARKGLPMVFDAGGLYLHETTRAVEEARQHGAAGVVVNHHPGANPAPAAAHNLAAIPAYKAALGLPVGLACHYRGEEILYAAVGLGVNLLEKGVVDDPDAADQDIISASRLSELPVILARVRACWDALGRFPVMPKEPRDLSTRTGMVAVRPLAAGDVIDEAAVRFAWPPVGISAGHWDLVAGRPLAHPLAAGQPIRWSDVAFGD